MRPRVKAIALATENAGLSPLLPLAAGALIALFAVSLAMAEPADRTGSTTLAAAQQVVPDTSLDLPSGNDGGIATDATTPDDTPILPRPLPPPNYHDRFSFYHRYDHLPARFNPSDVR